MNTLKIKSNDLPLIDKNGEVRELTIQDMPLFKPAYEVFNSKEYKERANSAKNEVLEANVRLDKYITNHLRASGKGWQIRLNAFIAKGIAQGEI